MSDEQPESNISGRERFMLSIGDHGNSITNLALAEALNKLAEEEPLEPKQIEETEAISKLFS